MSASVVVVNETNDLVDCIVSDKSVARTESGGDAADTGVRAVGPHFDLSSVEAAVERLLTDSPDTQTVEVPAVEVVDDMRAPKKADAVCPPEPMSRPSRSRVRKSLAEKFLTRVRKDWAAKRGVPVPPPPTLAEAFGLIDGRMASVECSRGLSAPFTAIKPAEKEKVRLVGAAKRKAYNNPIAYVDP